MVHLRLVAVWKTWGLTDVHTLHVPLYTYTKRRREKARQNMKQKHVSKASVTVKKTSQPQRFLLSICLFVAFGFLKSYFSYNPQAACETKGRSFQKPVLQPRA